MALSCIVCEIGPIGSSYSELLVENREIRILHLYLSLQQGVTPDMDMGQLIETQPNPTHQSTNPTQPNPQHVVHQPNPTHFHISLVETILFVILSIF